MKRYISSLFNKFSVPVLILLLLLLSQMKLYAEGEMYVSAYNELVKGLNSRYELVHNFALSSVEIPENFTTIYPKQREIAEYNYRVNQARAAVPGDIFLLKKLLGTSVTQGDLNDLRTRVIGLMTGNFLTYGSPTGNPNNANTINDLLLMGIRYKSGSDGFGNTLIEEESLMKGIGNGNAFTMVPGEYTSTEKGVYKNNFTNIPLLWIHFEELADAIEKMKWAKFNDVEWFDGELKCCYHVGYTGGPRGYVSVLSGGDEIQLDFPWNNFAGGIRSCKELWTKHAEWIPADSLMLNQYTLTPHPSEFLENSSNRNIPMWWSEFGYVTAARWAVKHIILMRKAAKAKKSYIVETDGGNFYGLQVKKYLRRWWNDSHFEIIPISKSVKSYSVKKEEDIGCYMTEAPFKEYRKDSYPTEMPYDDPSVISHEGGQPLPYPNDFSTSIGEYINSICFVTTKQFENPDLEKPEMKDSDADGVLATGCTCTSCKMTIQEEFDSLAQCHEVKFALGMSNGNRDGLKVKAYITESNFIEGKEVAGQDDDKAAQSWKSQAYSLHTKILGNYPGNITEINPQTGNEDHEWCFVLVKRPTGPEVLFTLFGEEDIKYKTINTNNSYTISKIDNVNYEIKFFNGDYPIYHKFTNDLLVQCRQATDGGELITDFSGQEGQWYGLSTVYDVKPKINVVESPLGKAYPLYDVKGLVYDVVYKNNADEIVQRLTSTEEQVDDHTWKTTYKGYSASGALETQKSVTWNTQTNDLKTETWNIEGGVATSVAETVTDSSYYENDLFVTLRVTEIDNKSTTQMIKYKSYPWGREPVEERIAVDTDDEKVTLYEHSKHGITFSQYPDGSWVRYNYDNKGRLTSTISPFGNAAPGSALNQCRVTYYHYTPSAPGELEDVDDHRLRMTVENVLGSEVSRSYAVFFPTETRRIRCVAPGAAWNDPANLTTVYTSYESTHQYKGRPKQVIQPAGTFTVYSYVLNGDDLITTVDSGAGTGLTVTDGTRSITEVDENGNTVSNSTVDIASNLELSSATYTRDDFGRVTRVDYSDGTHTETVYGCCGPESQTNREGTVTTLAYNTLKQLSFTTTAGITTLYTYDVQGNVISTTRKGTDNSEITTSSTYNAAGELISTTDASGNITRYQEKIINNQRVNTTIYPDKTTSIQAYNRDGSLHETKGNAVHSVKYEYGIENGQLFTKVIPVGNETAWTKTFTDFSGQNYKTVYADTSESVTYYDNVKRPVKQVDPAGRITLTAYNAKSEVEATAVDMDKNSQIDYAGTDRITKYENIVTSAHGTTVNKNTRLVLPVNNDPATLEVSTSETSVDGLQSWSTSFGRTSHTQTVFNGGGLKTVTSTNPDGSTITQVYQDGRLATSTHSVLGTTTYTYDSHGRLLTEKRNENGEEKTTTYSYNNNDQVVSIVDPAGRTTTYKYDNMGRRIETVLPSGKSVYYQYSLTGELLKTYGADTYPVQYSYGPQGRMKTLTTYRDQSNGQGDVTTWNYDPQRGFMTSKIYADGKGTTYTYNSDGSLNTRGWARNVTTTYSYDNAGDLGGVTYSDGSTAPVAYVRDRLGRITSVTDGKGTHNLTYNNDSSLASASVPYIVDHTVEYSYDNLGRRTGMTLNNNTAPAANTAFTYDAMSRLATVSDGTNTATYTRIPGTSLLDTTTVNNGTADILTVNRDYDKLNRLTSISSTTPLSTSSFQYQYDDSDRRIKCTLADGTYWKYQYDEKGQVISGKKYTPQGEPINGQCFGYEYDDIGNRKQCSSGILPEYPSTYTANSLNQYTQRTVPDKFVVAGSTGTENAGVVIVDQVDDTKVKPEQQGRYFAEEYTVDNAVGPVRKEFKIVAAEHDDQLNKDIFSPQDLFVFTPKTPEEYQYDPDGNLLKDGRFLYQWDAENRLLKVESIIETDENGEPVYYDGDIVAEFTYDYMGRRVSKNVSRYFVIPGTEGGGDGWIEEKTREIEEELAATIAKINERLTRQVTRFEAQKERIQNNPRIPDRIKQRLLANLDRLIAKAQENAQKKIEHEQEKAAEKIAGLEEWREKKIVKLEKKIEKIEKARGKAVAAIDKTIERLNRRKPRNYERIIARLEASKQRIIDKAAERIAKIQAEIDELQNGGGGEPTPEVREWRVVTNEAYIFDNWNVIAQIDITEETDPDTGEVTTTESLGKTHMRGEDLSGSLQGAGGVGGLLAVTDSTNTYLPTYDANGNVMVYVDSSDGSKVAEYEYSPSPEVIVKSGEKADELLEVAGFSTKPHFEDIILYEMRTVRNGRFLSRDPVNERGFTAVSKVVEDDKFNLLYGFVSNNTINIWDYLGLEIRAREALNCIKDNSLLGCYTETERDAIVRGWRQSMAGGTCYYCFKARIAPITCGACAIMLGVDVGVVLACMYINS